MSDIDVISAVVELAPDAMSLSAIDDALVLRSDEVTLRIERADGGWLVHKQWRNDDRGVVFRSPEVTDVARYLLTLFTNDIRRTHGLAPVRRKITMSDDGVALPADGFTLSGDLDTGFVLSAGDDEPARFFASDIEAARFSHVASDDLDSIRSSILAG